MVNILWPWVSVNVIEQVLFYPRTDKFSSRTMVASPVSISFSLGWIFISGKVLLKIWSWRLLPVGVSYNRFLVRRSPFLRHFLCVCKTSFSSSGKTIVEWLSYIVNGGAFDGSGEGTRSYSSLTICVKIARIPHFVRVGISPQESSTYNSSFSYRSKS